jgi:multiple sugar transport system permease protein
MVVFLAALQSIPQHLFEAAMIDGANRWQMFRHITLPIISPTTFFLLVMGIIGSFQIFTSAFVMTKGGPADSTLFYVLYLYENAFQHFRMGYASALAWVLFVIILGFTVLQFKVAGKWVHYENLR